MDEAGGLVMMAELTPGPGPGPSFRDDEQVGVPHPHGEAVAKGAVPAVDGQRHPYPYGGHQEKPETRTREEREGGCQSDSKEYDRQQGENVDEDDHHPDLGLAYEMISEGLQHFPLSVFYLELQHPACLFLTRYEGPGQGFKKDRGIPLEWESPESDGCGCARHVVKGTDNLYGPL
jgi:hypothetical protein